MRCVGARGDCCESWGGGSVYVCLLEKECVCVRLTEWGCPCCMLVWQETRSRDLKNTCLGSFWDRCFELTVLFGFGSRWIFQRAGWDKRQVSRAYSWYTFSILRFQPFIAINFERLQSVLFFTLDYRLTIWQIQYEQVVHIVVVKFKMSFRFSLDLFVIY